MINEKKNNGNYHEHKLYLWLQLLCVAVSKCASIKLVFPYPPNSMNIIYFSFECDSIDWKMCHNQFQIKQ